MSINMDPSLTSKAQRFLKPYLLAVVNAALRFRGTKLPAYFYLRDRVSYLVNGLEPSVVRVAKTILRSGDTAIDIGANVGFLTREFASLVGCSGRVYSFEPDPATFECLFFNTRSCGQVMRSALAISDHNDSTTLYLHPTSGMSNSLVNAWDNARRLQVQTSTLDAWIQANGIGNIKLIKIDVEGAEALVLNGMKETLQSQKALHIIMEFCPKNLGNVTVEEEIFSRLQGQGYTLQIITPTGSLQPVEVSAQVHLILNDNGYANLLCRRRKV